MKVCYTAGQVKKLENCFSVSTNAVEIRIWFLTDDILRIRAGFGMTEIQFGVMLIFNMCLGNITPPVGSVLFVGCGIGHVSIEQVTSKLIPYFVALVLALLAVTYIPALSLGLPSLMGLI